MELLELPEEVIEGCILPLLEWNDLLRFRRVCRTTRDITTSYMKIHPELAPEIEITEEGDRSLKSFMEMGIPTTKLFLDTEASGYRFYEKNAKDIDRFLKEYGAIVKSLRVKELTLYIHGKEREFLGGLVNLENLEADYFGAGTGAKAVTHQEFDLALAHCVNLAKKNPELLETGLPQVLAPLKKLKLKIGQKRHLAIPNCLFLMQSVALHCQGLEYLSLPFNTLPVLPHLKGLIPEEHRGSSKLMGLAFDFLNTSLERNILQYQKTNLKVIDFANYHDLLDGDEGRKIMRCGSLYFQLLCAICLEFGIKLMNVEPYWFSIRHALQLNSALAKDEVGKVVLSLVNIKPFVFDLQMPNLERIEIRNTSKSYTMLLRGQSRPVWPSLRILEICVDSSMVTVSTLSQGEVTLQTMELFNFFFKDIRRLALTELSLTFKEGEGQLAVPKTEDIVSACPNLKKLKIVNWRGTNKALTKLWRGLPGLEDVSLENCKLLGNVAFVGENPGKPVFFMLKKLKKLSLKGLDLMPKITDTLFSLVIHHLKLSHFNITSNGPISSVTLAGVETLLTGPFKDSIEKFPFRDWSLENVTVAEFKATEKKFRSYNML